jgi:hypothetical protein
VSISLNFRQSAYRSESGNFPIVLTTLTHASLTTPIRISSDPTARVIATDENVVYGTVSRGETFIFIPLKIKLPDDTDSGPGVMLMEIDNVDRALTETVRNIHTPVDAMIEVVMSNALNTVDLVFPQYQMSNISLDAGVITATLTLDNFTREPFPGAIATPTTTPGLFV